LGRNGWHGGVIISLWVTPPIIPPGISSRALMLYSWVFVSLAQVAKLPHPTVKCSNLCDVDSAITHISINSEWNTDWVVRESDW
jgi:hypothetical protein